MKNSRRRIALGMLALFVAFLVAGYCEMLGVSSYDVDVSTGRVRSRVLLCGVFVKDTVEETEFSRAVRQYHLGGDCEEYRLAGYRSVGLQKLFGSTIGCGKYGEAVATMNSAYTSMKINPELRKHEKEIVAKLLTLLQIGEVKEMSRFVSELENHAW